MKKIRFLTLALTLLTVNIAFAADEIHWTVTGQNSVTFDWRGTTTEKTIGYGLTSGVYTQVTATTPNPVPVSSSGPFWEAKLTGLTANTRYYYQIGTGPEKTFRTAPAPGSSNFNVYAEGNIGSTSTYFNTGVIQDIVANDLPSFVVGLGDLTLGRKNGKATIDQHFNDVMVWSKEAAYMPVWGDMDTISSSNESFKNYKGRFAVLNPQTSPGSPLAGGEDWYWFDYGNVRFITLPEPWTGAWADWKTKAGTLMAQAQGNSNIKFIVTFVHRPAYSSGHYPGSSVLKTSLDKLGDTYSKYKLNINAHSNNYERSLPQHGIIHVTVGTGGANLTQDGTCLWLTCAKPAWSAFRAMHLGALKLKFTATGIEGSFICGPAGGGTNDITCTKGSIVDSFTIGFPRSILACAEGQTPLNVSGATSDGSYSYRIKKSFGTPADNNNFNTQSTLRLFENSLEIGPPHSRQADVRNVGLGRYSHWSNTDGTGESIYFSTSDNTDPRTNGKSYCVNATVGGTYAIYTEPYTLRPDYLIPYTDPTFNSKVTRIAGNIGTPMNFSQGGTDTWNAYVRHNYAKQQPWNADQSLLLIDNANRRIYLDGNTYQPKFTDGVNNYSRGDDRWHPKLPNIRVNTYNEVLEWFDVVKGVQTRNWTLPITPNWGIGSGEGNTSSDGRYVALASATSMFIIDMDPQAPLISYGSGNKRIGPARDISDGGTIDWVSVSPSGKYAVIMYFRGRPRVFDIDPKTLALTPRTLPSGSAQCNQGDPTQGYLVPIGHADMTMNPFDKNEDVIIGQRQSKCGAGGWSSVQMIRLKDNTITSLTTGITSTMSHISARNLQRPGWVYVTYFDPANYQWDVQGLRYSDELVAIKIDGSGFIERLAHAHTLSLNNYNAEAHAVASPDGKRVLWASNWVLFGNGPDNNDIKPYVVDTRR